MITFNGGSFRDPCGTVFENENGIYRTINPSYKADYDRFIDSGLYDELRADGLIVPHREISDKDFDRLGAYKIIKPDRVPFISYPYEWCFSQLKAAARLTLRIAGKALQRGMILKDASAFNIQFFKGRPTLLDTLSFERYEEGKPWVAYRQFCQHFLAPLALMSDRDPSLSRLFIQFLDGIPLDLAVSLLAKKNKLKPSLFLHLFLHAGSQRRYEDKDVPRARLRVSRIQLEGILQSLDNAIRSIECAVPRTQWVEYADRNSYSTLAMREKKAAVDRILASTGGRTAWDVGANTGAFSRIAAARQYDVIAFDADHAAVETLYNELAASNETGILPLVADITNPSPAIGWNNSERTRLTERGHPDVVLALALIHHLRIGNNVPLAMILDFFASLAPTVILEFVPKSDIQVRKMLASREDIFTDYSQDVFEELAGTRFSIAESVRLADSGRVLYSLKRK
jgi:hypothetical protein